MLEEAEAPSEPQTLPPKPKLTETLNQESIVVPVAELNRFLSTVLAATKSNARYLKEIFRAHLKEQATGANGQETLREIPKPALPDGIGMTVKEVRELFVREHNRFLPEDSEVFVQLALLNAFLASIQAIEDRHHNALKEIFREKIAEYLGVVQLTTSSLERALSEATVETIKKVFADFQVTLAKDRINRYWTTAITALSAGTIAGVFLYVFLNVMTKR